VEDVTAPVVELIGMKRPFVALKQLNMDEIGKIVLSAIEN